MVLLAVAALMSAVADGGTLIYSCHVSSGNICSPRGCLPFEGQPKVRFELREHEVRYCGLSNYDKCQSYDADIAVSDANITATSYSRREKKFALSIDLGSVQFSAVELTVFGGMTMFAFGDCKATH